MKNKLSLYLICICCIGLASPEASGRRTPASEYVSISFDELILKAQEHLEQRDYDLAKPYIERAVALARNQRNPNASFQVYNLQYTFLINSSQYDEARELAQKQKKEKLSNLQLASVELDLYNLNLRVGAKDTDSRHLDQAKKLLGSDTLSEIGIDYFSALAHANVLNLDYVEAFENYSKVLLIYEMLGQEPSVGSLHNLSSLYQEVLAFELSLENDKRNLDLAKRNGDVRDEIFTLYSISTNLYYLNRYEESIEACQTAIALSDSSKVTTAIGYAYAMLGRSLGKLMREEEALRYTKKGLAISLAQNEAKESADCYISLAQIYAQKGEYKQALQAAVEAKEKRNYFDIELIEILSSIYKELREEEKYLHHLEIISDYYKNHNRNSGFYKMITKLIEDKFSDEATQIKELYEQESRQKMINLGVVSMTIVLSVLIFFLLKQKRLNEQLLVLNVDLEKRNEDLKQFAYITSHDLKEPIRNVKSFIGLVAHKLKKNDSLYQETKEFIHYISNSASTLSKIVETLRVYTSLSNGETTREKVDIRGVVHDLECNIHEVYKDKRPKIRIINKSRSNDMLFNREMLHLLLSNLMRNAVVHNDKDHPEIQLTIQEQSNAYIFQVSDNGPGIESAYFGKIFEPFKTLKNKSLTHSSGLGLSICKNILDRYGERIWVESTPSVGTTFSFTVTKQAYTDVQQAKQAAYTTAMLN